MLHVDHGVYLLETPPVTHHYSYTQGRSGTTRQMHSPLLADGKIISTSGYYAYMKGSEPSPNPYTYSSLSFALSDGTTYEITQVAETTAQGRTRYARYVNGTKSTSYYSYDEPAELSYIVTNWGYDSAGEYIAGIIQPTWKYKQAGGTYATTTTGMGKGGVLLRQGDRTQTDYAYSISESIS